MTLKRKLIIGTAASVIPVLAALVFIILYAYLPANRSVEELRTIYQNQVVPILRIEASLHKSAMPPNDFMISLDPAQEDRYDRLVSEVEAEFQAIEETHAQHAEMTSQDLLNDARASWMQSKSLAQEIFSLDESDVRSPTAVELMETFDAKVDQAAERIDLLTIHINEQLASLIRKTEHRQSVGLVVTVIGLFVGLILAVVTSIWILGNVLRSVQALYEGVASIKSGDPGAIESKNRLIDEFDGLFDAFNAMSNFVSAERQRLEEKAVTDTLTGLFNRDVLFTMMRSEVTRLTETVDSRRKGDKYSFSLLMLDLDNFKRVNDTYGHPVGDRVLREVASCIRSIIRSSDCVSRYGGEEIGIYLAQTGEAGALELAERIRVAIESLSILNSSSEKVSVTASFGVATYPKHSQDIDNLVNEADKALYRAKHTGRNRVCIAEP